MDIDKVTKRTSFYSKCYDCREFHFLDFYTHCFHLYIFGKYKVNILTNVTVPVITLRL